MDNMENNDPNDNLSNAIAGDLDGADLLNDMDFDAGWRDEIGQDIEAQDQSDWDDEKAQLYGADTNWDESEPYEHDDAYDVDSALGSAGMGTDEFYGDMPF